ncbi:hypothetical protein SAMN05444369_105109 [Capnocytophaga haemolytica]|uniref:Uncharacterized protein n=2 Tax=Capnocytophaga haemolytica TaxID=45243 RepID=A0AAX2H0Y8_9FLAO|nr:hypothetical protein SAMN05444369_105109 [Capnocytophaga haemolytica]SNV12381.1 Uncharacterised protein [Capnocytophaga haemolytica]
MYLCPHTSNLKPDNMVTYLIIINSVLLTLIVVLSGMFLWRKHLNRDSERRRFIFEFVADSPVLLYYACYI